MDLEVLEVVSGAAVTGVAGLLAWVVRHIKSHARIEGHIKQSAERDIQNGKAHEDITGEIVLNRGEIIEVGKTVARIEGRMNGARG